MVLIDVFNGLINQTSLSKHYSDSCDYNVAQDKACQSNEVDKGNILLTETTIRCRSFRSASQKTLLATYDGL